MGNWKGWEGGDDGGGGVELGYDSVGRESRWGIGDGMGYVGDGEQCSMDESGKQDQDDVQEGEKKEES